MQEPGSGPQPPPYNAPIPEPSGYIPPVISSGVNDSGTGAGAVLPSELKGFSWAAALMTWIWAIGHQFWMGLIVIPVSVVLGLIPIIGFLLNIGLMVFFGVKGNEWAWQHRRWESIEQFRSTQRVWTIWGVVLMVLFILLGLGFGFMAAMLARSNPAAFQPQP
jgi:hypothetical protein